MAVSTRDPAGGSDSGGGSTNLPATLPPNPSSIALPNARAASGVLEYGNWTPALFIPYRRSIGGIIAQVTIDEQHTDEVQITDHPVEAGIPISDHAFKRPQSVNITAGWSQAVAYDLSAETGVYGLLLSWQAAFMPFDVVTGKRHYTNMLIERLVVTTDQHNEFSLVAQIGCRQVIIVKTQTTSVQTQSSSENNHSEAEKTAPNQKNGDKSTRDTDGGKDYGGGGDTSGKGLGSRDVHDEGAAPVGERTAENSAQVESFDPFTGARQSPESTKVETTAVKNATPDALAEKNLAVTTSIATSTF